MDAPMFLALSALGPDRPGLVAEVTELVTARGGNVEDSRMAVLGAEFGILLLVSGPEAKLTAIEAGLAELGRATALAFTARRTRSPDDHRRAAVIPCEVRAEALDHEGIVHRVARALSGIGVNIVSLETTAYEAPVTGSQLFRLIARVDVPQGVALARLRKAMTEVGEQENLDVDVRSLIGG